jgi:hypothetical protein
MCEVIPRKLKGVIPTQLELYQININEERCPFVTAAAQMSTPSRFVFLVTQQFNFVLFRDKK